MAGEDRGDRIDGGGHGLRLWFRRGSILAIPLLLLLVACAVPCVIRLGTRDSKHTMENVAVVVSQETWLRWHDGEPDAWLVTSNDSLPRVRKPPMLTWLNFMAWSGLDPATARPVELLHRARLLSVGLGMLMLASVFWLGNTLGDARLGIVSTLVAGSIFLLQRQMRTASYDIHFAAWVTLAVAAALWAVNPRAVAAARWRGLLGWMASGLAMAAATMTKNPLAMILVALPVAGAIAVTPHRRRSSTVGLVAALVLALLIVSPWYAYVAATYTDAVTALKEEFRAARSDPQPPWYYLGLLGLVMPWTPWLLAGLAHPFVPATRQLRRQRLVAWVWFVILFVFFSIPAAKQQRYILPIIPALALLIGQVWADHAAMARRGERDESAELVIRAHWIILLLGSLIIGPFLAFQDDAIRAIGAARDAELSYLRETGEASGMIGEWLAGDGWPAQPLLGSVPWPVAAVLTFVLLALVWWGWRQHVRWRPMSAAVVSGVWTLVVLGAFWYAYGERPSGVHPIRASAEEFASKVGEDGALSLRITELDRRTDILNEEFRFYYGRRIPHTTPETLADDLAAAAGTTYVLARDEPAAAALLRSHDLHDDGLVKMDQEQYFRVWRRSRGGR